MFSEVYSPQWNSLVTQLIKNLPAMQEVPLDSWGGKIRWRRDRLPTPIFLGFPNGSAGKESAYNVGDLCSITGLGRCPGEGKGYLLQARILEWVAFPFYRGSSQPRDGTQVSCIAGRFFTS